MGPSRSAEAESGPDHRLVIFDCDGVLVDSEVLVATVESDLLRRFGVDVEVGAAAQQIRERPYARFGLQDQA